jgi:hypothetical protein
MLGFIEEIWKHSKSLIDIKYPSSKEPSGSRELDLLVNSIDEVIDNPDSASIPIVIKQLFMKKVVLQNDLNNLDVKRLEDNLENHDLFAGDKDLLKTFLNEKSLPQNKMERIKFLNHILDKLEVM